MIGFPQKQGPLLGFRRTSGRLRKQAVRVQFPILHIMVLTILVAPIEYSARTMLIAAACGFAIGIERAIPALKCRRRVADKAPSPCDL